jgi:hypothetical protein
MEYTPTKKVRRKQFDELGPAGYLATLRETEPREKDLEEVRHDVWIALTLIADRDAEGILTCWVWEDEDLADIIFRMPGYQLAAHAHPDLLIGYLHYLMCGLFPGSSRQDRHELATWLGNAFRPNDKVPFGFGKDGWKFI